MGERKENRRKLAGLKTENSTKTLLTIFAILFPDSLAGRASNILVMSQRTNHQFSTVCVNDVHSITCEYKAMFNDNYIFTRLKAE